MTSYLGNESPEKKIPNFQPHNLPLDANAKIRLELAITVLEKKRKNWFSRKKKTDLSKKIRQVTVKISFKFGEANMI